MRAHLVTAALLASACAHTLRVPAPAPAGPGAPLPPPAPARIEAPLRAELRDTLARLEARVPRTFDTGGRHQSLGPTPVGVRYEVAREPFRFTATGASLHAETTLTLRAEACVGAPAGLPLPVPIPFLGGGGNAGVCQPIASCGVEEPARRVVVSTDTTVRLDPSWRLTAHTVPAPARVVDPCLLSMFRVDVSAFVASVVEQQVSAATQEMDAHVAALGDLRPQAESLWRALHEPVDLGEGFWLSLRPAALTASPFTLDTATVRTTVGVVARPEVTTARPSVAPTPLPPLTEGATEGDAGFHLGFDATVRWSDATALVRREFQGRTLELQGYRVHVLDMRVRPHGGALLFEVDARFDSGPFAGQQATVHLAGLPDWDARRRAVVMRELDYSLETRNALLRVGESMMRGSLRDELADKAVFPLGDRIDRVRARAEQALSRELAPGTTLRGTLSTVTPRGAFVTPEGVVLRVDVSGRVEVSQDLRALPLAR